MPITFSHDNDVATRAQVDFFERRNRAASDERHEKWRKPKPKYQRVKGEIILERAFKKAMMLRETSKRPQR